MSLADVIRGAIATARTITLPLHVTVTHEAWTGQDSQGAPTYVSKTRKALVERKQRLVKNMDGEMVNSSAYVAFIEPVPPTTPLSGFNRTNPVDVKDIITLPDGTKSPIASVDGFFDGGTGVPYYTQVYLG